MAYKIYRIFAIQSVFPTERTLRPSVESVQQFVLLSMLKDAFPFTCAWLGLEGKDRGHLLMCVVDLSCFFSEVFDLVFGHVL